MSTTVIIVALVILAIVVLAYAPKKIDPITTTHDEVASAIEGFLAGTGGDHDWDDFLHYPFTDSYLESVRKKCEAIFTEFPATEKGHYCSAEGIEVLRKLAAEVRDRKEPNKSITDQRASRVADC